jgi:hypothetical protein
MLAELGAVLPERPRLGISAMWRDRRTLKMPATVLPLRAHNIERAAAVVSLAVKGP